MNIQRTLPLSPTKAPATQSAVVSWAAVGFLAITAIAVIGAFVGLTASSLWLDELFSVHFAAPSQSPQAMVVRALEDVHPPLYYVLLYLVGQLPLDFETSARGFSAVLATLAIVVVYTAPTRDIGATARAAACAFAATSSAWFYYAQEVRSYALAFLIVACLIHVALRFVRHLQAGRIAPRRLAVIAGISILGGMTHIYILAVAGSAIAFFIYLSKNWRHRFVLAGTGLLILGVVAAQALWQQQYVVPQVDRLHFTAAPGQLLHSLLTGGDEIFGSFAGLILLPILGGGLALQWIGWGRNKVISSNWPYIYFLIFIPFTALLLTLLTTFTIIPIFSARFFNVILPFVWVFFAYAFQATLQAKKFHIPLVLLALALLFLANEKLSIRLEPQRNDWRASALHVAKFTQCEDAVIPVTAIHDTPYLTEDELLVFYGHYLHAKSSSRFLRVERKQVMESIAKDPLRALMQSRIYNESACPVLLWSMRGAHNLRDIAANLQALYPPPPGREVTVFTFPRVAVPTLKVPFTSYRRYLSPSIIWVRSR